MTPFVMRPNSIDTNVPQRVYNTTLYSRVCLIYKKAKNQ